MVPLVIDMGQILCLVSPLQCHLPSRSIDCASRPSYRKFRMIGIQSEHIRLTAHCVRVEQGTWDTESLAVAALPLKLQRVSLSAVFVK